MSLRDSLKAPSHAACRQDMHSGTPVDDRAAEADGEQNLGTQMLPELPRSSSSSGTMLALQTDELAPPSTSVANKMAQKKVSLVRCIFLSEVDQRPQQRSG
eukprot:GHVU01106439.1.p3 GENE.GHVU01106439.1~~GHVU01106439.1.p3  ORF type:complete len:101 (+),score=9.41 GHVU01106439.1:232-534(+)